MIHGAVAEGGVTAETAAIMVLLTVRAGIGTKETAGVITGDGEMPVTGGRRQPITRGIRATRRPAGTAGAIGRWLSIWVICSLPFMRSA